MATTPKTRIFLDTYHPMADGKCAVKLEVYFDRKRRHYLTEHKLSQEEFNNLYTGDKLSKKQKEVREDFVILEHKAKEIIKSIQGSFSFTRFEKMFVQQKGNSSSVFVIMEQKAKDLRRDGKISSAVILECAVNSLKTFYPKNTITFDTMSVDFFKSYEKWMKEEGNSTTTIGIYVRPVRTIFNEAIEEGTIPKEIYPFRGKKGYTIPTGRNIKKALTMTDIAAIYNYVPKTNSQVKAKDFWLFSYLANGINIKDMAKLKFKNIDGDMIRFERAKTDHTNKDQPVTISFAITPDIKRIIKKWGNKSIYSGNYIFPILENKITPEQEYNLVQLFTKFINKNMQKIAKELKIKAHITTYVARHSFSTVVRNSGRSIAEISEALGHKNIKTTQNYLAGFDDKSKKEVAEVLTNFSKTGTE